MAISIGNLEDMLFFPYNSVLDDFEEEDRLYDSQDWADYFKQFIGNGIFPNPANGLKTESLNDSMVLTIRAGAAFANGRLYMQRIDFRFSVAPAHLTLGRRDIVVCRHDSINRTMQLLYIEGTASSVPAVPEIVRTDDIFDLKLCEITVNPNVQSLSQANILDTRLNSEVCGIVHGVVDQVDTTDIFNQYMAALNEFLEYQADRITEFNIEFDSFRAVMNSLVTKSFALINNDFDDWSVKLGCQRDTIFKEDGSMEETIVILDSGETFAERITKFIDENTITETVKFIPRLVDVGVNIVLTTALEMTKTTIFNEDGSVTERADGIYHGPTLDFENDSPINIELNIPQILDGGAF